ncbi:YesL family protein [Paenibacillus sp. D51F]
MEMRGIMGGFYRISEWIMRLAVTNILWIVCSLPFAFFVFTAFLSTGLEENAMSMFYWWLVMGLAAAPFTLFPATSAMFGVARKWVMGDLDVPLFRTYFRHYKENYLQSMIGGIVYALLFGIMIVDFKYFQGNSSLQLVSYVFLGLILLLGISLFNFFSMVVHYHMKTFQLLKNAVLITIGRPLRSFSTAIVSGFIIYISFSTKLTWLIPFFMGSIIAYFAFWNFYLTYQKIQAQTEARNKEAEEDALEAELSEDTKK